MGKLCLEELPAPCSHQTDQTGTQQNQAGGLRNRRGNGGGLDGIQPVVKVVLGVTMLGGVGVGEGSIQSGHGPDQEGACTGTVVIVRNGGAGSVEETKVGIGASDV